MKNLLFETLDLFVNQKGITRVRVRSHYGAQEVTLSPRELDIWIAELVNHRRLVDEKVREEEIRRNLEAEQKRSS